MSINIQTKQISVPTVILANGVELPCVSLGTAFLVLNGDKMNDKNMPRQFSGLAPENVFRQVQVALESGIRSIETARVYRAHRPIGHVLGEWFRVGQLSRKDVFLTTKVFHGSAVSLATKNSHLWNLDELSPDQVTEAVTNEIEESLLDLNVGYIDLMLLHWPASAYNDQPKPKPLSPTINRDRRIAAWQVLEHYYAKGWIRAIGVSNFSEQHLDQLLQDGAKIVPMVNQIEASLSVQYPKILEYCQNHGIACQAFSPLKRGMFMETNYGAQVLKDMAEKYSRTEAQIVLRYLIQKGYAITFLSTSGDRMASNHDIFDFQLTEKEMSILSGYAREGGNWGLGTPYDFE
jgi:diketogulonate reductase-like aldo/keto reductase